MRARAVLQQRSWCCCQCLLGYKFKLPCKLQSAKDGYPSPVPVVTSRSVPVAPSHENASRRTHMGASRSPSVRWLARGRGIRRADTCWNCDGYCFPASKLQNVYGGWVVKIRFTSGSTIFNEIMKAAEARTRELAMQPAAMPTPPASTEASATTTAAGSSGRFTVPHQGSALDHMMQCTSQPTWSRTTS